MSAVKHLNDREALGKARRLDDPVDFFQYLWSSIFYKRNAQRFSCPRAIKVQCDKFIKCIPSFQCGFNRSFGPFKNAAFLVVNKDRAQVGFSPR